MGLARMPDEEDLSMFDPNQESDLAILQRLDLDEGRAKEEMVLKYLPMVKHIVKRYYAPSLEFDDLMQEGLIGLLSAIDEYRPQEFNVKFSSFAYICIIRKVYNVIKQSNGNKHKALNTAVSLQSFVNVDETRTVLDLICDEESDYDPLKAIEAKIIDERVEEVLRAHLSLLEYTVASYLLQGYTCGEIEEAIGVKAKVIDNARTRVKAKLRRIIRNHGSLLNPSVPTKVRQRKDLYLDLKMGS
ncbi:MAG: sigma-70 family RNA polymerase sigma factor [Firmicutes bacterium]|nr:sigma-70 family RNA polymerase sigma factor [Bacillota bacterium]